MKEDFIKFLNALMEAAPDVAESMMDDNIKSYIEALQTEKENKPELTENGKMVLASLQASDRTNWTAKGVADELFISSKTVSGAFRKLVTDGFCEKVGANPVVYVLTEKGKNYKITEKESEND